MNTAAINEQQGEKAWSALKFQYPDAAYETDGWWYSGSLRAGEEPVRSKGSLLALTLELVRREQVRF